MPRTLDLDVASQLGTVTYNGFIFPPALKATVEFSPEYSDDGRTQKYMRADLSIEFVLVNGMGDSGTLSPSVGGSTEEAMKRARRRLSRPGQKLEFTARGIGTNGADTKFTIQDGIKFDVNNGPKPKIIAWQPIAHNRACRVVWRCSTWYPECDLQNGLTGLAQLRFSISWGQSDAGLLTRTISGAYEIPLSRTPSSSNTSALTTLRASADDIWEQVYSHFAPLTRYERTHTHSLSDDRKIVDFSISDTEIDSINPYYPGVVKMTARRRYSSSIDVGFLQWSGSVSGNIEVAPGYSRYRAWLAFVTLFKDIFDRRGKGFYGSTRSTEGQTEPGATDTRKPSFAFLTSIDIDEDLFGRGFSFSFGYLLTCDLGTLFDATGLFTPLDSISPSVVSWNLWRLSMDKVQSPRGWGFSRSGEQWVGAKFDKTDDVIVDLCTPSGYLPGITKQDAGTKNDSEIVAANKKKPQGINPDGTWILYECEVEIHGDDGTVTSIPLQSNIAPLSDNNPRPTLADIVDPASVEVVPRGTSSAGEQPALPVIHRSRPTQYTAVFTGRAARVGYQISAPNLIKIGGKQAFKTGKDRITPKVISKGTEVTTGKPYTIYGLTWRKEYTLSGLPADGKIVTDGHVAMYP